MRSPTKPSTATGRKRVRVGNSHFHLPGSVWARRAIGVFLVLGGVLGFLPVLGFWMLPLGVLILSVDSPIVRRWRRQFEVWFVRRWYGSRVQVLWIRTSHRLSQLWRRLKGNRGTGIT